MLQFIVSLALYLSLSVSLWAGISLSLLPEDYPQHHTYIQMDMALRPQNLHECEHKARQRLHEILQKQKFAEEAGRLRSVWTDALPSQDLDLHKNAMPSEDLEFVGYFLRQSCLMSEQRVARLFLRKCQLDLEMQQARCEAIGEAEGYDPAAFEILARDHRHTRNLAVVGNTLVFAGTGFLAVAGTFSLRLGALTSAMRSATVYNNNGLAMAIDAGFVSLLAGGGSQVLLTGVVAASDAINPFYWHDRAEVYAFYENFQSGLKNPDLIEDLETQLRRHASLELAPNNVLSYHYSDLSLGQIEAALAKDLHNWQRRQQKQSRLLEEKISALYQRQQNKIQNVVIPGF